MRFTAILSALILVATCAVADDTAARRHDFPRVGNYQVMCGDFHMHTSYGEGHKPGVPSPRERVEESYRLGYDAIAVTDHGTMAAYKVASYCASRLGLVLIRGLETGVNGNEHMNALGVSEQYQPVNPHHWWKKPGGPNIYYQDAMKAVADAGGLLVYNHPHCGYKISQWGVDHGYIIGIEVKNDIAGEKLAATDFHGSLCYPDAFDYALKNNLAVFADTDVHGWRKDKPSVTLVLASERSGKGVTDAIRARRTIAWFDGMLWGRQNLLTELISACVKVSMGDDGHVRLQNLSPIDLSFSSADSPDATRSLPAYGSATAPCGTPGLSLTWQNVWTDPRTRLVTTLPLPK